MSGIVTSRFLFDLESNMRMITENQYARMSSRLWYQKVMKLLTSGSRKEMVHWLLSTAQIEDLGEGGNIPFEAIVGTYTTYEQRMAGAGLKVNRTELEDLDGNGVKVAAKWASDIGAYMAYWPQKVAANLLMTGHNVASLSYDGVPFFSASHLLHPQDPSRGTFKNIFTGGASGSFPGACPIDATNATTVDVAANNLAKIVAYIRSIKMPNGVDPRFLNPVQLIVPPALQSRAVQLTNAKYIAQAAASGGGGADVEAVIQSFGWMQPIVADELAGFESDTTFFVVCEEAGSDQLGGLVYVDREPFKITYYTGQGGGTGADAELNRKDELEWHAKGRNVGGYGHPYMIFKCKGT